MLAPVTSRSHVAVATIVLVLSVGVFVSLFNGNAQEHNNTQDISFLKYGEFIGMLDSKDAAKKIEYVALRHPDFEYECYERHKFVMCVKLSNQEFERVVLIPDGTDCQIQAMLNARNITAVACD